MIFHILPYYEKYCGGGRGAAEKKMEKRDRIMEKCASKMGYIHLCTLCDKKVE